jgi:hypothetical protein
VYGQGNFIFNYIGSELEETGILLKTVIKNGNLDVAYIPIKKAEKSVRLASGQEAENILSGFRKRSEEILEPGFIDQNFNKHAAEYFDFYLRSLSGWSRKLNFFDRRFLKGRLIGKFFSQSKLLRVRNHVECEAHRESLLAAIKAHTKESGARE